MNKKFYNNRYHKIRHNRLLSLAALFVGITLTLAGCGGEAPLALLDKLQTGAEKVEDSSYDGAAFSIDRYCARVPERLRLHVRRNINRRTDNGDIAIICGGDALIGATNESGASHAE